MRTCTFQLQFRNLDDKQPTSVRRLFAHVIAHGRGQLGRAVVARGDCYGHISLYKSLCTALRVPLGSQNFVDVRVVVFLLNLSNATLLFSLSSRNVFSLFLLSSLSLTHQSYDVIFCFLFLLLQAAAEHTVCTIRTGWLTLHSPLALPLPMRSNPVASALLAPRSHSYQ